MKKVLAIIFISFLLLGNISFAINDPIPCDPACDEITQECDTTIGICLPKTQEQMDEEQCGGTGTYNTIDQSCEMATTNNMNEGDTINTDTPMGMTIDEECLLNGQCKFNVYDALGIRQSIRNPGDETSVGLFVQDIVLAVTMFIGTVVTLAIIVSGLMWIFAGATGKDPTKAKSGLINALIGLLIVTCSYLIIRVVQYIAKGV